MSYFTALTVAIIAFSVVAFTLIVGAMRRSSGIKLFVCLYLILVAHWITTGGDSFKDSVNCSYIKEKS